MYFIRLIFNLNWQRTRRRQNSQVLNFGDLYICGVCNPQRFIFARININFTAYINVCVAAVCIKSIFCIYVKLYEAYFFHILYIYKLNWNLWNFCVQEFRSHIHCEVIFKLCVYEHQCWSVCCLYIYLLIPSGRGFCHATGPTSNHTYIHAQILQCIESAHIVNWRINYIRCWAVVYFIYLYLFTWGCCAVASSSLVCIVKYFVYFA